MSTTLQETGLRTGTWQVDPEHSHLGWSVKHLGIAKVRGWFEDYSGKVEIGAAGSFRVEGLVKASSLRTGNKNRDIHIRSDEDFFQVERYPDIRFASEDIQPAGEGMYIIDGVLTLHGHQRPVSWQAYLGGYAQDLGGDQRMALNVSGELNRKEWGMDWNRFLEAGGMLVSERVQIDLDLSLIHND